MYNVYCLVFSKDGFPDRFYVGRSRDLERRIASHLRALRKNRHHNSVLSKLVESGYVFSRCMSVEVETFELAKSLEVGTILFGRFMGCVVNIEFAGNTYHFHPDKDSISIKKSNTTKRNISKLSKEQRIEIFGRIGSQNGMFGKKHSDDTRALISSKNKGKLIGLKRGEFSEEHRKKISDFAKTRCGEKNPFFGKSHSLETKLRLSEAMKGSVPKNAKSVEINGVLYSSMAEASRALSVPVPTIHHRVRSKNPKFSDWRLL